MMKLWNLNLALLFPTTDINLSYFVKSQVHHLLSLFFRDEIQYSSTAHDSVIKMPPLCTVEAKETHNTIFLRWIVRTVSWNSLPNTTPRVDSIPLDFLPYHWHKPAPHAATQFYPISVPRYFP